MSARLDLRQIAKSFDGKSALADVSLTVLASEVHVIAGENGAGKSTLIRILSGVYDDYTGTIELDGKPVRIQSPAQARALGIHTIHQELSLVPSLSVLDNAYLTQPGPIFQRFSRALAGAHAKRLLALVELDVDPELPVERLSLSERQLLEIARAIGEEARVLILDEPTSALSAPEAERLFTTLERFCARGTSVIYISHRLDEIYRVAHRISVVRDGRLLLTQTPKELPEAALLGAMLGERLRTESRRARAKDATRDGQMRLSVKGLGCPGRPALESVDFELRSGEVLGIAGLRGSGAGRVPHALFGGISGVSGEISLMGSAYRPSSPRAALRRRLALLPSDRRQGVFADLSILSNATLSSLGRFSRLGVVDRKQEARVVFPKARALKLGGGSLAAPARWLSGGNQQKLLLLRSLLSSPQVLLLDDPLRGVDVGAKADVYDLILELAESGLAILFHSSELEDLLRVCDRVLVFSDGRIASIVSGDNLSREGLLAAIMGRSA